MNEGQAPTVIKSRIAGRVNGGCLPILMQGAAAHWPARDKWSLDWLVEHHGQRMCKVRVASSLKFTYTDDGLLRYYVFFRGKRRAPSVLVDMSLAEFTERSRPGCSLPSLIYPPGTERYYLQSALTADLRKDIDLRQKPFSIAAAAGFGDRIGPSRSQVARMWVSPQGAVSPLHFDATSSFLVQLQGRKRMLFWPPSDLPGLYPYHNLHLLRRRARVDPTIPDYKRFPRFRDTAAYEAIIEPGDVMFFPSCWAHYTESLESSISVTCRFGGTEYHESVRPGLLW
ncbi:hypothetical protein WJX84_007473 [Apatococcus fuscideae]|uniref:JmjC domain-containing protein n=1 Tax=Apatococcus fuscideae TaxID=2026836 RepID=A0AAW1T6I4_9CHLO